MNMDMDIFEYEYKADVSDRISILYLLKSTQIVYC
jgi:hypothetical protein